MVVEVAVDPADVVSIPTDYNNAKMRCAKYQLLGVNSELTERRQAYLPEYNEYSAYDDGDEDLWLEDEEDEVDNYYEDEYVDEAAEIYADESYVERPYYF